MDPLKYINKMIDMYEGPRITAQEPRIELAGGQLVQPGVGRQGYKGEKPVAGSFDEFSDAVLNSYAKDDITFIKDYKYSNNITRSKTNSRGYLDKLVEKTGLDEDTILNLFEDRESLYELEGRKGGAPPRESKFYKQAENWITKNSSRYADPDKFKKAFVRVFGKNNDLIKTINKLAKDATGRKKTSVPFSNWFKETILGTTEGVKAGYNSSQLNSIFKTSIYTNNPNVRKNITKEIKRLLSMPMAKGGKFDIRDEIKSSKIFKQFGFDKQIRGPIARLLANEITESLIIPGSGKKVLKQISAFRDPYLPTEQLVKYLSDRVDSKYKSMFDETAKAVSHAVKQQWPEAKKALNIADDIMFDHRIPKELVKLGYADEIEYIKLNPTSKEFNTRIKNPQFDQKIIKLAHQWKKATTVDAKAKIVGEMNTLKDKFSKKYGNYLEDVKITPDRTGKPIFSSTADVVTKKTDLVKSLETSLQQEKFPTMNKKQQHKFLKEAGFNIDKCLSEGGRVKLQGGKGVNTCITGVINDEMKLAKKSGNVAKFSKFGKLASKAGWIVGWADIPIELAFALPSLLAGDVQGAKRATTAGLFGYGGKRLEGIDPEKNPEAYKYFKHVQDINDWMDAFNQQQNAESKWSNIDKEYIEKYKKEGDPSGVMDRVVDQYEEAVAKQENIVENYKGYVNEEGEEDIRLIDLGKEEGKKYLKEETAKEWKSGMDIDITMPDALPGSVKFNWAPFKPDEITSLEQQIKQKGEPHYGKWWKRGVKHKAEELGAPELYDDWYDAFYGRDPRDAYSDLPLDWASQLAALEKKEWSEDPRTVEPSAVEQWIWNKKHGYATGGIANLTRTVAPDSGPMQGLASTPEYATYRKEYKWQT